MDGKGRWLDNVFIERLWRSLKQECVYLNAFDSMRDATGQIGRWIAYYNRERPHSSLGGRTPLKPTCSRCSSKPRDEPDQPYRHGFRAAVHSSA